MPIQDFAYMTTVSVLFNSQAKHSRITISKDILYYWEYNVMDVMANEEGTRLICRLHRRKNKTYDFIGHSANGGIILEQNFPNLTSSLFIVTHFIVDTINELYSKENIKNMMFMKDFLLFRKLLQDFFHY